MAFKSSEYSFKDLKIVLGKRPVTGFREITYSEEREVTLIRASGDKPHARVKGDKTFAGQIELLQSEVLALEDTAKQLYGPNASITDLEFDIIVGYIPSVNGIPIIGASMRIDFLNDCCITKWEKSLKVGDENMNVVLPLSIGDIKLGA